MAAWRRWRWLILVCGPVSAFIVELLEHETVTDPHFWREILIYGLAIPVIVWIILTLLIHQAERRNAAEIQSVWYRKLKSGLEQRQEWTELSRFIVRFPATFLPIDHAALFLYDHASARIRFVTEWNALGRSGAYPDRYRSTNALCQTCFATKSGTVHPIGQCGFVTTSATASAVSEYCQPIFYDGLLIGVLLLCCKTGRDLYDEQQEQLRMAAVPIAVAIILSIARRTQMDQTRYQATSEERQRVATELHDSLGQMICCLRLDLDRLTNDERLLGYDDLKGDLARMLQVADRAYDEIRSDLWVMQSWRTPDLMQAIADYIRFVTPGAALDIQLNIKGKPTFLEPRAAYQVFTLVREGLNNVVAHAHAQHACVELRWTDDQLLVQVSDDGVGFDPLLASLPGHYGLQTMRERALALNGTLLIDSAPGQSGTRLSFTLPVKDGLVASVAEAPPLGSSLIK